MAKKFMKSDFSTLSFSDESRAILDEPDHWVKGYVLHGNS